MTPKKLARSMSRSARTPGKWTMSRTEEMLPASPMVPKSERSQDDFQLFARLTYAGNVQMIITTEFLVNKPFPRFLSLPITLKMQEGNFLGNPARFFFFFLSSTFDASLLHRARACRLCWQGNQLLPLFRGHRERVWLFSIPFLLF